MFLDSIGEGDRESPYIYRMECSHFDLNYSLTSLQATLQT